MFQNFAENILRKKEDVKVNKVGENIISKVFKIQNIIVYILAFLITSVKIDDSIAPFGMAIFAATCGTTIPAGMVLISTMLSTLINYGVNDLLVYTLTVLVFVLSVIVLKPRINESRNEVSKLGKNVLFSVILVQAIKIFTGEFLIYDFVMAVALAIITYVFYKIFVNSLDVIGNFKEKSAFTIEEVIGASVLISIASVALSGVKIYGLSISNIISIFLILVLGWKNGILVGTTSGVSTGVVLGIIGAITPMQVLSFAVSGFISGALSRFGKFGVAFGFLIGNMVLSYISNGNSTQIIQFQEILIAFVGLIFVPQYVEINIEDLIGNKKLLSSPPSNGLSEKREIKNKLNDVSSTITEMIKSYGITEEDKIVEELEGINTSREMFVEDFLSNVDAFPNNFLYDDLVDTKNNIIEDIYIKIAENGKINSNDLIDIFEKRNNYIVNANEDEVIKMDIDQVVRIANRTFKVNELNFSWKKKLQENKETLSKTMSGVSNVISDIAENIAKPKEDKHRQKEKIILGTLRQKDFNIRDIKVRQNKNGKYFVDLILDDVISKDKTIFIENLISKVCEEKIIFKSDSRNLDLDGFMQKYSSEDKYILQVGIARAIKSGNNVSGDSDLQIKLDDDKYLFAICDGMGSGIEAKKSSQVVVKMIRKLLSAGFDKNDSIDLINSTVKLSSEEIYSTLDMAILDLYSGNIEFVKNGAAKTYIKNDKKIDEIKSESLPLGILNNVDFTAYDKDIHEGDIIVMCSDGITDSDNNTDDWIKKVLRGLNTNNVQRISDIILNEAIDNNYGIIKDDMTIITIKIVKKKK